ncbi:uncharacterized protein K02A2.6-like [Teleopsis dalmanni]|uniref:uncharacterized protein K02A2.6-like n=2 Tax=Teleopsis dalmanni TaxID=139649 RepID=UPI0018CCC53F|nr:uncharacterized protein K02A2.6-like [Teleopsis dalmanni]
MNPQEFKLFFQEMQNQRAKDTEAMRELFKECLQMKAVPKTENPEQTMEILASSLTEFVYDPENNLTFETWYTRYEDLFLVDGSKLDDAAKVRLLLRKLSTTVHNKYMDFILPKHPREYNFTTTVEKLKQLFGLQKSQFSLRYSCLQLTKPPDADYTTYAAEVNKQCENFKLNSLSLDQFKCLMFVLGLKSEADFEIRTRILTKLDTEADTINLEKLTNECQRIINLKSDTALVENKSRENQVNRVQANKLKNNHKPKTPCWFCGAMHYVRDCPYKNYKCEDCHNIGHKKVQPESAKSATGNLPLYAKFTCDVQLKDTIRTLTCFVTTIDLNVFGLDWITVFQLSDMTLNAICSQISTTKQASNVSIKSSNCKFLPEKLFPELFDNAMGLCNKTKAHLIIKPNCQPVFRPKRPVAYAVQHLVEEEIKRLQDLDIIAPINYSDWAAPIVVIKKPNGSIHICADFSTGLNDALESYKYPLPLPEDIFAKISNATVFSHIDLSDAFLQIEVDSKSQELLTINTHLGLFKYKRMVFGVKTFPAIFQQIMDKMLAGLDCAAAYIDDIFVSGRNQQEHDNNLHEVLQRIYQYGFKLKIAKCNFSVPEIAYLGYIVSKDGIRPDPKNIEAIKTMPAPTNQSELRSLLGAINFYGKFINHMRKYRGPLDELLQNNKQWQWTELHQRCLDGFKQILSSELLLAHYDPLKNIVVAADASNYGLGACIFHEADDGSMKVICHASRSLTPTEKQYSQIEKEALALIFAVTKFHRMVFGRRFKLQTDHKPLLAIFGDKTGIKVHQANRLQRWAIKLIAYDFELKFISTNSFGYADVLSRLIHNTINPSEDYVIAAVEFEIESKQILHNSLDKLPLTSKMITYETAKDKVLAKILEYVTKGWPSNCNNSELKAYFNRKNDICIVDGCLMFGQRIIIPQIFRKRILKEIHRGHQGIGRTKAIARNYVYWSNIDHDIEAMVKSCSNCAAAAKMPTKTTLHPWAKPSDSWERLHIDYAGPIDSYYYLVVIDAFSKWPEIIQTKSITATQTISSLKEIFARFGLPKTIVSDNGTQFVSHQFQQFLAENGISHIRSSPYYPMSNGQAERFVDTLKRALKKLNGKGVTAENLQTFLQVYRSTPNKQNEDSKSPAEVLLKRKIRIKLDLIKPTLVSDPNVKFKNKCDTQLKMKAQFDKRHGAKPKFYEKQELVYVNIFKNKHFEWTKGKIIERIGNVIYNVRLQNGKLIRAHANQIRDRKDQENELSLEICTSEDIANEKCLVDAFGLYETTDQSFNKVTEIAIPQTEKHNEAVVPYTRPRRTRHPIDRYRP